MTTEQRASIREDCKKMTRREVATRYGITRQRVSQIVLGKDEHRPRRSRFLAPPTLASTGTPVVAFVGKHKRLADAATQQQMRDRALRGESYESIAASYNCTYYAVQKVVQYTVPSSGPGRLPIAPPASVGTVSISTRRLAALADPIVQAEIRASGEPEPLIAARFGCSRGTIHRIRFGQELKSADQVRAKVARDLAILDESKTLTRRQLSEKWGLGQTNIFRIVVGRSLANSIRHGYVLDTVSAACAITTSQCQNPASS